MKIDINVKAANKYVLTLGAMSRSALPVAVRSALNSTAFDVKQKTMPASADREFINRKKTFFKANSTVQPAQGFQITSMKSVVGFKGKSGNDHSVDDLEQQEHGGKIGGRSFIPLAGARTSKNWNKMVKAGLRIGAIADKLIDSQEVGGKNEKEQYIKSAVHAKKGGILLGNTKKNGNRTLFLVNSVKRDGKDTKVNTTPIYIVKKGRSVQVDSTHFMKESAEKSRDKMKGFFEIEAKKQIAKYYK